MDGARCKERSWGQWKITYIEALERLMEPEDEEVSRRYILKYSMRGCSNIFQLFDTAEKEGNKTRKLAKMSGVIFKY